MRRRRASLESSIRSSSKVNSQGQSPKAITEDEEKNRVLPSLLMRRWKKVGRILNIANTLVKLRVQDRLILISGKGNIYTYVYDWRSCSDPEVNRDSDDIDGHDDNVDDDGLDDDCFVSYDSHDSKSIC